jgi:hypothetical protein
MAYAIKKLSGILLPLIARLTQYQFFGDDHGL